jgi:hypothetical protein
MKVPDAWASGWEPPKPSLIYRLAGSEIPDRATKAASGYARSSAALECFAQGFGIAEVGRFKPFREPSIDRREKIAGFHAFAVLSP